jgi:hypothetical protein
MESSNQMLFHNQAWQNWPEGLIISFLNVGRPGQWRGFALRERKRECVNFVLYVGVQRAICLENISSYGAMSYFPRIGYVLHHHNVTSKHNSMTRPFAFRQRPRRKLCQAGKQFWLASNGAVTLLEKRVLQLFKKKPGVVERAHICNPRGSSESFQSCKNLQRFFRLEITMKNP